MPADRGNILDHGARPVGLDGQRSGAQAGRGPVPEETVVQPSRGQVL